LASGSAWSRVTQQVALNGEETSLPPTVPPPPGAHPPPTVWNPSPPSSSWQGEGDQPDGLQTLLFLPHPTPETSRSKENRISKSDEHKESLENKKSTAENKKEERNRKISQEAVGNVRKIMKKIEERRRKEDPYLQVPGPEARHANVPVPRGVSGTWVSSSSSSSGGRTGASQSSISKFSGDKGHLDKETGKGAKFILMEH
jgi:hypothetical protein